MLLRAVLCCECFIIGLAWCWKMCNLGHYVVLTVWSWGHYIMLGISGSGACVLLGTCTVLETVFPCGCVVLGILFDAGDILGCGAMGFLGGLYVSGNYVFGSA